MVSVLFAPGKAAWEEAFKVFLRTAFSDDSAPRKRSRTLPLASSDAPHDEVSRCVHGRLRRSRLTKVKPVHNFTQVLCMIENGEVFLRTALSDDSAPRKRSRTLPLASTDAPHDEVSSGVIWKLRKANWTTVKRGRNFTHFSQVLCGWRVAPERHFGTLLLLRIARFYYNTHKSTFILTCIGAVGFCLYHSCRQLTGIG